MWEQLRRPWVTVASSVVILGATSLAAGDGVLTAVLKVVAAGFVVLVVLGLGCLSLSQTRSLRLRVVGLAAVHLWRLGYLFFVTILLFSAFLGSCAFVVGSRPSATGGRAIVFMLAFLILGTRTMLAVVLSGYRALRAALATPRARRAVRGVRLDQFKAPGSSVGRCDVLVFSDLHLTAPGERAMEGDMTDEGAIAFMRAALEWARPQMIIVSGDVTDTGARGAWDKARSILSSAGARLVVAPGNHDVHFKRTNRKVSKWSAIRSLVELPESMGALHGTRMRLFASTGIDIDRYVDMGGVSYSERDVFHRVLELAPGGITKTKYSSLDPPFADPQFPIVYDEPQLRLTVLVLNSNRRPSSWPMSNAFGFVGDDQLERAQILLDDNRTAGCALLVVLHHHVLPPPGLGGALLQCFDAPEVWSFARKNRAAAIIHGHTHMPYVVQVEPEQPTIVSCGSVAYPAGGPCASQIVSPSCFGLQIRDGTLRAVVTYIPPAHQLSLRT
jgi:predicted phosphodiesterase